MASVAPWLAVSPADYLTAAIQGRDAGLRMAQFLSSVGNDQQANARANQAQEDQEKQQKAADLMRQQQIALDAAQSSAALRQKATQDQAQNLLQAVGESRMLSDSELANQARKDQLGLESQRTGLEAERFLRPRTIKAANGGEYAFDANGNLIPLLPPGPSVDPAKKAVLDSLTRQSDGLLQALRALPDQTSDTAKNLLAAYEEKANQVDDYQKLLTSSPPLSPTVGTGTSNPPAATGTGTINGMSIDQFLGNAPQLQPLPTAAEAGINVAAEDEPNPNQKPAQGGYKIGAMYKGGLVYLGGDPQDQNSWQQSQ